MTSASATGGKKRGRRRHQTVIEQSSGLDRVFIWDIDGSLVPSDIIGQALEPSVLPSVADKLGHLSKRLREITISFCDQHMFLSEVESSDQMHIDDIPKDLEQPAPAVSGGPPPTPPVTTNQQQLHQPASPASGANLAQMYHQPAITNGFQDHQHHYSPSATPAGYQQADYQQQQYQEANQQELTNYQIHKVEPPETNYASYASNPPASTGIVEDISQAAAAAAAAAAAYAHSEPHWLEPSQQHHFQLPPPPPPTIQPNHHHQDYSFEQQQQQHYHQPAVHYPEQQPVSAQTGEQNSYQQPDFAISHQPAQAAYADYQHQFHHHHHHHHHQQHNHLHNNHHNSHHQQQPEQLANYQLVEPLESKYAYSSAGDISGSGNGPAGYQNEQLWLEPNNNNHHFLAPTNHEHYLFEQASQQQQLQEQSCQYQQEHHQQLHQQQPAAESNHQVGEQNGNGQYQQEFGAQTPVLETISAYQSDQYQQAPFAALHPAQTNQLQEETQQNSVISQLQQQQQNNQSEQQELLRPASNLNSKLQVIDSAFLNKPLKNVLSSHHSRLAYKLFDLKAKDVKLHDELETILTEIDRYTLDWRKRSMDCLKLILESNNCTNLIVTKLPLVVALGHLICLNLGQYFDVDQIYSAIRTNSKEACIKRIKKRFGATNRCSYIIVGDREDVEMAKKLSLPSWITTRSDGHRQLLQLYTALKEGYLM